jgi:NADH dehydrogenase [ubiquinone] 1 alpha subcomplex assembly factor 7
MKQALTHPVYGYYTRKIEHDDFYDDEEEEDFDGKTKNNNNHVTLIGKHGDFTTAPEVSQIFGESILIWFVYQWRQTSMVKEKALTLIEVGPGRGTLMADILGSSLKSFPDFVEALCRGGGIHLVETSSSLRELQRVAIQRAFDNGNTGSIKLLFCDENPSKIDDNQSLVLRVQWHEILGTVPNTTKNGPQMFLAQEFIDALPVHSFQKTSEDGVWRERLVDVDAIDLDNFVGPNSTPIDKSKDEAAKSIVQPPDKKPRLRFILSPKVTPALRSLMKTDECGRVQGDRRISDDAVDGDVLEVCPEGLSFVQDVSSRINLCGGACLIVDYGSGKGTGDSIRAFKSHKQVPVLSLPGEVDITAGKHTPHTPLMMIRRNKEDNVCHLSYNLQLPLYYFVTNNRCRLPCII